MSESLQALRRANPRAGTGFAASVEAATGALRAQLVTAASDVGPEAGAPGSGGGRPRRRRLGRVSAVGASLAVAAAAERSGTAVVRITHNGKPWAGTTVRWRDGDLAVTRDVPPRPGKAGSKLLVVDGTLYGVDPVRGGWVVLGDPDHIDPDSGTTPDEYLAAAREDIGGATLRRITDAMTGLTTDQLGDGATVYRGTVAAGLIAREPGFKEGRSIRVLPFGHVAQGEAADPAAPLQVAATVGADGIVRELSVTWGTSASAWTYTVTYSDLGATPAPVAPASARPLKPRPPAANPRPGIGG